ncbi:MAG: redox-regulated ATPase YchF [Methanobacteriota archaeon]
MIVGVVGKPNVGKSTFFKALTLADAEIAAFPFTTIKANVGVGYVRSPCPVSGESFECNPKNGFCRNNVRFTPIKLIDVAGLVPGAHEGKGLGNQFLDDLRQADALIHVVDISGKTNEMGEACEDHNPSEDIKFLEEEVNAWFAQVLRKNWEKVSGKIKFEGKKLIKELAPVLAGLSISENQIHDALAELDFLDKKEWSGDELKDFAVRLREISKPILVAANKIDLDSSHFEDLKGDFDLTPVCAEAELALRQAEKAGLIEYTPGEGDFKVLGELGEKQSKALDFVRENVLSKWDGTGVQKVLDKVVFDVLNQIVVYPVENENKMSDSRGNILPDSYLVTSGSTVLDLAFKVHTDFGEKFISAVDAKTKMKVGRDHVLADGDVIKIVSGR